MKNDDLLNINPKNNKKPLIYIALGFLVFVVVVILVAIFQNLSNEKNNEILPPNPEVKQQKTTEEFKPIPVQEESSMQQEENQSSLGEENTTKAATNTQNTLPIKNSHPTQEKVNNIEQQTNKQKTTKKTAKNIPQNVTKSEKTVKKPTKVINGKYYIQVAALLKNAKPNKKFIALLKKYGFNYTFVQTYIKKGDQKIKVTKILVGPYSNYKEAKKALNKIKKEITQNAFIYRVK